MCALLSFGGNKRLSVLNESYLKYLTYFLPFLLRFLNLGPGISERYGPVEYHPAIGRIRIHAEVTQPFELVTVSRGCAF